MMLLTISAAALIQAIGENLVTGAHGLLMIFVVMAALSNGHGAQAGAATFTPSALTKTERQQTSLKREWSPRPDMVFFTSSDVGYILVKPKRNQLADSTVKDGSYQAHGSATVGTTLQIGDRLQIAGAVTSRTQRQRDAENRQITDRVDAAVNAAYESPLGQFSVGYSPATLATNADTLAPNRLTLQLSRPGWRQGSWRATDHIGWLRVDPEGLDGGYEEFSLSRRLETVLKGLPKGESWTLAIEPGVKVRQFAPSPNPSIADHRDITASLAATWRHLITSAINVTARLNVEKIYSNRDSVDQAQAGIRLRVAARF